MKSRLALMAALALLLVLAVVGVTLAAPPNSATIYDIACEDGTAFDEAAIPGGMVSNGQGAIVGLVVDSNRVGTAHSLYFCAAAGCSGPADGGWVNIWVRGTPPNTVWCEWTVIDGYAGDCDALLPNPVCFGGDILLSP